MAKYRKKPVIIEAIVFDGKDFGIFEHFVPQDLRYYNPEDNSWYIKTLEGDHRITIGDYIIKGIKGEFYPCKPDIFKNTYELVGEEN